MMQASLLEAAVEDVVRTDGLRSKRATVDDCYCPECENLLLDNSNFCMVCGTSVRSSSQARRAMNEPRRSRAPRLRRRRRRMTEQPRTAAQPPVQPAGQPPVQPAYAPRRRSNRRTRRCLRSSGPAATATRRAGPGRSCADGAGRVGRVLLVEPRQDDRADRGRVVAIGASAASVRRSSAATTRTPSPTRPRGGTEPGEEVTPEPDGGHPLAGARSARPRLSPATGPAAADRGALAAPDRRGDPDPRPGAGR